jgi:hypothetical protein
MSLKVFHLYLSDVSQIVADCEFARFGEISRAGRVI